MATWRGEVRLLARWLAERASLRAHPGDYARAVRYGAMCWRSYLSAAGEARALIAEVEAE